MELRTMPSSNCTGERSVNGFWKRSWNPENCHVQGVQGFTPCRKQSPFHFPRREDFLGVMALMLLGRKLIGGNKWLETESLWGFVPMAPKILVWMLYIRTYRLTTCRHTLFYVVDVLVELNLLETGSWDSQCIRRSGHADTVQGAWSGFLNLFYGWGWTSVNLCLFACASCWVLTKPLLLPFPHRSVPCRLSISRAGEQLEPAFNEHIQQQPNCNPCRRRKLNR